MRFLRLSFFLLVFTSVVILFLGHKVAAQTPSGEQDTQIVNVNRNGTEHKAKVLKETLDPQGKPARTGSIIVKFRKNVSQPQEDKVNLDAGALKVEKLYLDKTRRVSVNPQNVSQ